MSGLAAASATLQVFIVVWMSHTCRGFRFAVFKPTDIQERNST